MSLSKIRLVLASILFACVSSGSFAAGWTEDFESYTAGHSATLMSANWENPTAPEEVLILSTAVGLNTTKKMSGMYWGDAWVKRPLGVKPAGDVILTAQLAIDSATHPSHPLANHVMLGNVACGIAGKRMSYKVYPIGGFPKDITTATEFTKIGTDLPGATWYEIKMIVHQVKGYGNDTADFYYKQLGSSSWIKVVLSLHLGADLQDSPFVYLLPRNADAGKGYIDNVTVSYTPADELLTNIFRDNMESYTVGYSDNQMGTSWQNISAQTNRKIHVIDVNIGGNISKKATATNFGYPWMRRAFQRPASGDVTLYSKMALAAGTVHTSHPLACHVMLGNAAFGIAGNKLAYKVYTPGTYPKAISDPAEFTKVGSVLLATKWYDLKIVVHQVEGTANDTADLYYKDTGSSSWTAAIKGLAMNYDLDGYVHYFTVKFDPYQAYVDDIELTFADSKDSGAVVWSDGFETYLVNNSSWAEQTGVPWDNFSWGGYYYGRVFKPAYDSTTYNKVIWQVENNTSNVFTGITDSLTWYSRPLGTIDSEARVIATAQVANYNHTITTAHSAWPLAGHVVLGGVALGISGDDISYQVLPPAYVPEFTGIFTSTSVTRAAPAAFKKWYDVKIAINQVPGANNDIADLYYKPSTDLSWTLIAQGVATGQDLGNAVYVHCNSGGATYPNPPYYALFDNVELRVADPEALACGDTGTNFLPADLNGDCYIDLADFARFAQEWMICYSVDSIDCN